MTIKELYEQLKKAGLENKKLFILVEKHDECSSWFDTDEIDSWFLDPMGEQLYLEHYFYE